MIPMLTVMADFMGIVGGYFYSVVILRVDMHHYWQNSQEYVGNWDFGSGVVKELLFWIGDRVGQLLPWLQL